jgi:hypothetical protein
VLTNLRPYFLGRGRNHAPSSTSTMEHTRSIVASTQKWHVFIPWPAMCRTRRNTAAENIRKHGILITLTSLCCRSARARSIRSAALTPSPYRRGRVV